MRKTGLALLTLALAGASPPHGTSSAPATMQRYLADLVHRDFAGAYHLLTPADRRYFRSPANFASVFVSGGVRIDRYRLGPVRRSGSDAVFLADERITFTDERTGAQRSADGRVLYGLAGTPEGWRIHDPGHPWRAFASQSSTTKAGLSVQIVETEWFARRIEVIARFTDVGSSAVTVLPYARSVLRDDRGAVFHPLVSRDTRLMDRRLFEGIRLAPASRYTGFLDFETPAHYRDTRTFTLRIEPALRDGAPRPFAVTVANIAGAS